MLVSERLLAQAVPVSAWAAANCGSHAVNLLRYSNTAQSNWAGNSMHAACVAAVFSWVLVNVEVLLKQGQDAEGNST